MPRATSRNPAPLLLVYGDDDMAVKSRAREVFQEWSAQWEGMDHEIIDASAANSGEALGSLARLREALDTLPFFGGGKVIWFQNCNFLGDERTASSQSVTAALNDLAQSWKEFPWKDVRLIITSGKVDKRKTFYKTVSGMGAVEVFAGWSGDDPGWVQEAEAAATRQFRELNVRIESDALAELVSRVGPNARQLRSEVEKVALYAGEGKAVRIEDIDAIATRNKQSKAFELGEALGERDLPRLMRALDQELWEMRSSTQKSEIGVLYGLISKVRAMLLLKEPVEKRLLKPGADFRSFPAQLKGLPEGEFPEDKRFNPRLMSPYVAYKAARQVRNYTLAELVEAMDLLLQCNRQLIYSNVNGAIVLQATLVRIVQGKSERGRAAA